MTYRPSVCECVCHMSLACVFVQCGDGWLDARTCDGHLRRMPRELERAVGFDGGCGSNSIEFPCDNVSSIIRCIDATTNVTRFESFVLQWLYNAG